MRVLTYCVTAAPGAAQTLRRGFAGVSPSHITRKFKRKRINYNIQVQASERAKLTFMVQLATIISSLHCQRRTLVFAIPCLFELQPPLGSVHGGYIPNETTMTSHHKYPKLLDKLLQKMTHQ